MSISDFPIDHSTNRDQFKNGLRKYQNEIERTGPRGPDYPPNEKERASLAKRISDCYLEFLQHNANYLRQEKKLVLEVTTIVNGRALMNAETIRNFLTTAGLFDQESKLQKLLYELMEHPEDTVLLEQLRIAFEEASSRLTFLWQNPAQPYEKSMLAEAKTVLTELVKWVGHDTYVPYVSSSAPLRTLVKSMQKLRQMLPDSLADAACHFMEQTYALELTERLYEDETLREKVLFIIRDNLQEDSLPLDELWDGHFLLSVYIAFCRRSQIDVPLELSSLMEKISLKKAKTIEEMDKIEKFINDITVPSTYQDFVKEIGKIGSYLTQFAKLNPWRTIASLAQGRCARIYLLAEKQVDKLTLAFYPLIEGDQSLDFATRCRKYQEFNDAAGPYITLTLSPINELSFRIGEHLAELKEYDRSIELTSMRALYDDLQSFLKQYSSQLGERERERLELQCQALEIASHRTTPIIPREEAIARLSREIMALPVGKALLLPAGPKEHMVIFKIVRQDEHNFLLEMHDTALIGKTESKVDIIQRKVGAYHLKEFSVLTHLVEDATHDYYDFLEHLGTASTPSKLTRAEREEVVSLLKKGTSLEPVGERIGREQLQLENLANGQSFLLAYDIGRKIVLKFTRMDPDHFQVEYHLIEGFDPTWRRAALARIVEAKTLQDSAVLFSLLPEHQLSSDDHVSLAAFATLIGDEVSTELKYPIQVRGTCTFSSLMSYLKVELGKWFYHSIRAQMCLDAAIRIQKMAVADQSLGLLNQVLPKALLESRERYRKKIHKWQNQLTVEQKAISDLILSAMTKALGDPS